MYRIDKGNFYVKRNACKGDSWTLYYQYFENGKRKQDRVERMAYAELGFKLEMSTVEARTRCAQVNAERDVEKNKIRKSAERVTELKLLDKILFPPDDVQAFIEKLETDNFGSDAHLKRIIYSFNFIQKLVIDLKLSSPAKYKDESKAIFKYFIKRKVSLEYAAKLIALLNKWGKFISRKNGSFYDVVPNPKGRERSAIAEAQKTKRGTNTERGVRVESAPLTPEILQPLERKMQPEHFNWLYISVWLGLRPEEVDSLHDPKAFNLKTDGKTTVIGIYQSKLMQVPEAERWKYIPIIFKEQKKCLSIIESKIFERPLSKTVRRYCGDSITLYGGRKNFVDLCLDRNQNFVDIAAWMGHKDTSITFEIYKQRQVVRYSPVKKVSKLKIV